METKANTTILVILGIIVSLIFWTNGVPFATADTAEPEATGGLIVLSLEDMERPPVLFSHDKHAGTLEEDSCTICHAADEDGTLSYTYPPDVKGDSKNAYRAAYHKHCIGCHRDQDIVGTQRPPATCGECHAKKQAIPTIARPNAGFDYYSHNVHVDLTDNDCAACHHTGDMTSCRDCHRSGEDSEAQPFKDAAHSSCLKCHLEYGAGPATCGGCHTESKSWSAEDIAEAPRPEVGQPDSVMISINQASMNAVPFNHGKHEGYTASCRTCHHETMDTCGACHTITGSEEGGMVTLGFAYHEENSERSCVGCHNKQKTAHECAGCHHTMKNGMTQNSCRDCHSGDREPAAYAKGLCAASVSMSDNPPAEITIERIVTDDDKYLPVVFSHAAHAKKLTAVSNGNNLARYFHSDEMTVCAGCHHNSPLESQKPVPACSTCHTVSTKPRNQVPTLYGAYHQQCLGCHEKMNVEPVTCTGCHQEKGTDLQASAK